MLIMVLTLGAMATGCVGKSTEEESPKVTAGAEEEVTPEATPEGATEETKEEVAAPSFDGVDLSEIVKLPNYKGMNLEKTISPVTQEAIDAEINSALENAPEEDTTGVVDEGDTANIDFEGKIDDVAFEGGTGQGEDLKIGSGGFIPGFEEQLIGMKKGDTKDINVTFPEEYNEEVAGKDAVFTVKINDVKMVLGAPTDEWVTANTDYKSVDEYKASVEKSIEEYNEQAAEDDLATQAMNKLFEEAEVLSYPEEVMEYSEQVYEQNIQQYAEYAGQTLEEFIESQGMTMDQYKEDMEVSSKGIADQILVLNAVAQAEGIKTGDAAYKAELAKIVEGEQMPEETLFETYGKDNVEQSIMVRCVQNMILENANIKEVEAADVDAGDAEVETPAEDGDE